MRDYYVDSISMTEETIPSAGSLAEVNIHLGYLRRDIQNLSTQIAEQDSHYINMDEFKPIVETVAKHDKSIEKLEAFSNTLNGKLIGFGLAIGVFVSIATVVVQTIFHI